MKLTSNGNVETEGPIHATTWIVADFEDEAGSDLVKEALKGLVCSFLTPSGHPD